MTTFLTSNRCKQKKSNAACEFWQNFAPFNRNACKSQFYLQNSRNNLSILRKPSMEAFFWNVKGESVTTSCLASLCAVWDMVSQVSMLYMLLSLCMGWTLSRNRKPQSRPLQWEQSPASTAVAVGGVITQVGSFSFAPPWWCNSSKGGVKVISLSVWCRAVSRVCCCCGSSSLKLRAATTATTPSRAWQGSSSWPSESCSPCCWPPSSTRSSPPRGAPWRETFTSASPK